MLSSTPSVVPSPQNYWRRPSSQIGAPLCRARDETLSAESGRSLSVHKAERRPSVAIQGESLCAEPERRPSIPNQGWRHDSRGGGNWASGALEEKGPRVSQRAQNHLYNYCNCSTVQDHIKDRIDSWRHRYMTNAKIHIFCFIHKYIFTNARIQEKLLEKGSDGSVDTAMSTVVWVVVFWEYYIHNSTLGFVLCLCLQLNYKWSYDLPTVF